MLFILPVHSFIDLLSNFISHLKKLINHPALAVVIMAGAVYFLLKMFSEKNIQKHNKLYKHQTSSLCSPIVLSSLLMQNSQM